MTLSEYLIEAVANRTAGKYSERFIEFKHFKKHLEQSKNGVPFSRIYSDDLKELIWQNLINQRYNNIGQAMNILIGSDSKDSGKFFYFLNEKDGVIYLFTLGAVYQFTYFDGIMVSATKTPYAYNWSFLKKRFERHQLDIHGGPEFVREINSITK